MDEYEGHVFADDAVGDRDVYDGYGHTLLPRNAWSGLHVYVLHVCVRHHDAVLAHERRASYEVRSEGIKGTPGAAERGVCRREMGLYQRCNDKVRNSANTLSASDQEQLRPNAVANDANLRSLPPPRDWDPQSHDGSGHGHDAYDAVQCHSDYEQIGLDSVVHSSSRVPPQPFCSQGHRYVAWHWLSSYVYGHRPLAC